MAGKKYWKELENFKVNFCSKTESSHLVLAEPLTSRRRGVCDSVGVEAATEGGWVGVVASLTSTVGGRRNEDGCSACTHI